MSSYLRVDVQGPIAYLIVNRPDKGHAWASEMWSSAARILERLNEDADTRVIVLDSTGDDIFSGGADLFELRAIVSADEQATLTLLTQIEAVMSAIQTSPKSVIAVITGAAIGAGFELALSADIRLAADTARFGIPAVELGIVLTRSDVARLLRIAGASLATDLLLTGRILSAKEALTLGIVSSVEPVHQVRTAARRLAEKMATYPPGSIRALKHHILSLGMDERWGPAAYGESITSLRSTEFRERLDSRLGRPQQGNQP